MGLPERTGTPPGWTRAAREDRPMVTRTWSPRTEIVTDGLPAILMTILAILLALGVVAHVAVA